MQVMLVSHVAISTIVLMNPETLGHQVGSIFSTNDLWLEEILRKIFSVNEVHKQIILLPHL